MTAKPRLASPAINKVAQAAARSQRERELFLDTIREAHAAGESTRLIAAAAGLSHQRIHQIIHGR